MVTVCLLKSCWFAQKDLGVKLDSAPYGGSLKNVFTKNVYLFKCTLYVELFGEKLKQYCDYLNTYTGYIKLFIGN